MGACTHGSNNHNNHGGNDVSSKSSNTFHSMQYDDYQDELSQRSKQTIGGEEQGPSNKKKVKQIYSMINQPLDPKKMQKELTQKAANKNTNDVPDKEEWEDSKDMQLMLELDSPDSKQLSEQQEASDSKLSERRQDGTSESTLSVPAAGNQPEAAIV